MLVVELLRSHESHGAACDRTTAERSQLRLNCRSKQSKKDPDQIFELVLAHTDLRGLKRAARRERFQRLNETAALMGLEVALNGGRPGQGLRGDTIADCVLEKEDGPEGIDPISHK